MQFAQELHKSYIIFFICILSNELSYIYLDADGARWH